MVRSTIMKLKDEERIMVDLMDVIEEVSFLQDSEELKLLKKVYTDTIEYAEQKDNEPVVVEEKKE